MSSPSASSPSSSWVAEQFVPKFYDVLHKHPDFLSRFYKENSILSVWTDEHATAQGDLQAIQDVISNTIAHAQCFPQHVDSMYSIDRSVCIQVVGVMLLQGRERQYVQTFFLATQEHGFFVLNDMLHVFPATKESLPQPAPSPVAPIPPALARPAMQEEVAPYVPNPKLLQEMQASFNSSSPTMNGPAQQHPPPPMPPAPSPAPAPHAPAAARGQKPEVTAPASPAPHPAAPEARPKGGRGTSPVPPPAGQQISRPAAPQQPPKLQVPTPPPEMSMADRLKFIEQHKEMQRQALIAQQQAAQQQAAQHAQQQQQQQQQQAEPQQIEPQREDRPSRAMQQQQQRQQRQQQQQQGAPKASKPEQQQQQQQQQQESSSQQPTSNGNIQSQPPVHGVYVRNLPQGDELTEALLEEHFGQFGALKASTEVPAVTIVVSPKYGKVAYIKFEQGSSVQAARQSPPTIGTQRCEVLPMVPEYVNGPQPGMRGIGASRGGFRSGGAPRRGGNRFGDGGRPPRSGAGPEGRADRQGSPSSGPGTSNKDQGSSQPSERPPRPAGGLDRSAPGAERSSGSGGGGRGGGRRSRSGSASRPKRDQGGNGGGQPAPTPTYVPVAPKS